MTGLAKRSPRRTRLPTGRPTHPLSSKGARDPFDRGGRRCEPTSGKGDAVHRPPQRRSTGATFQGCELWSILLVVLTACAACGATQGLQANFARGGNSQEPGSTRHEEAQAIFARLQNVEPSSDVPAAVGVTGRGLRGRALPKGKTWHYEGSVDVLPSLAGDAVAFTGAGTVTVLDVETGTLRFTLPVSGRRLEGFASDGQYSVMLLVDSDDARQDQVLVVDPHGRIVSSATSLRRLGTPLAVAGMGLMPWGQQYVSAFELSTGQPIGRLLVRDAVHHVTLIDSTPWVLGQGALPLDEQLVESHGKNSLQLRPRPLPGQPGWPVDRSKPRPVRARPVALWAVPSFSVQEESKTQHHLERDTGFIHRTYVYGYYDLIVGLNTETERVRWTNYFPRSLLGGAANSQGVTVCLEDGKLLQLRWSDGRKRPAGSLDSRLKACAVRPLSTSMTGPPRKNLPIQVQRAIENTGPSMAAVQALLVEDLAQHQGAAVTRALLAIAQDPLTSTTLSERAAKSLARRRSGAEAMIRALKAGAPTTSGDPWGDGSHRSQGTSTLELPSAGRRPPPVIALAQALTAMKVTGAASTLVRYLENPGIEGEQSRAILQALFVLGGEKQLPEIRRFFATFKNGGGDEAFIEALVLAAQFLLTWGTEADRRQVVRAQTDVLTHPDLAEALKQLPETTNSKSSNLSE